MAKSKGGIKIVPACATCNWSKGSKALMQWLRDIKKSKKNKDKYRWKRITSHNKGKRGRIAKKVQKIRDE